MGLCEPLVGRPERSVGHPRERLVAGDAAGGELEHGLEDRDDRSLVREQRLDLGALPVARQVAREPAVVAAALVAARALGPVHRAVGQLEQAAGLARVGGERGDAGRARQRAAADLDGGDRGAGALGGLAGVVAVDAREDQRELLAAEPGDDVVLAHDRAQPVGRRDEHLVALGVAERVVDGLEVVEVDDDHAQRPVRGRGARDLLPQPLVAGAVVEQPGQAVRARLLAQRLAPPRRVEGERRHRGELLDLLDLGLGERAADAEPVDVEHGDDAVADDQRHRDERLRLELGPLDDGDDRVVVGALDVARAAVGDHPAGDALADRERVRHHLVGVGAEREHGAQHPGGAIDLVERDLVEVEQHAQVVRDAPERVGERIRREDPRRGVDQRLQRGGVGMPGPRRYGHRSAYRPRGTAA